MKKTLDFVDAMGSANIPAPFIEVLKSGLLDADQTRYLSRVMAEMAAVQAACKLTGDKLSGEEIDIIAEFLEWEKPFLFFITACFSETGLFDGDFDFASEFDEALREFVENFPLAKDDE